MADKIDLVLGAELQRVIQHLSAERGDKKIQDTIRALLLNSPDVQSAGKKYNADLSVVPERGGYRKRKSENVAHAANSPAPVPHSPPKTQWAGKPAPKTSIK
jgi:hypothetical protein